MGNKRSRDFTRPKERGKPTTCDLFELTVASEGPLLVVSLSTDLSQNLKVALSARRLCREADGREWYWTCLEESVALVGRDDGLNGFVLRITNDELDTKGLHMYHHLKRTMSVIIAAPPSEQLEVIASAPTTPHRFGLCNRRLTGKAVTVQSTGHLLVRSASVALPVSPALTAKLSF